MENSSSLKKKTNSSQWKRNVIKNAKIKGMEHINYAGTTIPAKTIGNPCSCSKKCFQTLTDGDQLVIFKRFYKLSTKNEQDIFLQGLIDVLPVQRKRPRKADGLRENAHSFRYYVLANDIKHQVCLQAFLSLYSVSMKRIRRIRDLASAGKSPHDMRGKQASSNAVCNETIQLVKEHILSFPVKESHYSGRPIRYLDEKLNVKIMYKLFKKNYSNTKISYISYYRYFVENFNLKFGRPQVDTCCVCEELNLKIKSPHLSESAKRSANAELTVHKRRSNKFYSAMKIDANEEKNDEHTLSIAFDYMQNIQLPRIPVQEIFYLRQLSINVFCIHDIKKNTGFFYVYHEGQANKGPNEVCTFLYDYLSNVPSSVKNVHLYSDNCGGQNKNHAITRMLLALTDCGRFEYIRHYFPIRGHSFLPCDRDFGLIKRSLKVHDRIYSLHEITELIVQSSSKQNFTVKEITGEDIMDFKSWWPALYKKNTISVETSSRDVPRIQKVSFAVAYFHSFEYYSTNQGQVVTKRYINGEPNTFKLNLPGRTVVDFPNKAYPRGKVHIKQSKLEDLQKVMRYIDHNHINFYKEILSWPASIERDDVSTDGED